MKKELLKEISFIKKLTSKLLSEEYDDNGEWIPTKPTDRDMYEGIFDDKKIMLIKEDADIVNYVLNNLPDSIQYISIVYCEFADFSGVDLCNKSDLMFVNLLGTKNNIEEQGYECIKRHSNDFYETYDEEFGPFRQR
jgi:hypothetical protein